MDDFPAGVVLVELALSATRLPLVPATIAQTMGVAEVAGKPVVEVLKSAVGDGRILLVLDNFEHVIDAAPSAGELLVGACPELRVLATSQRPLSLGHELPYAVPMLEYRLWSPDPAREAEAFTPEALASCEPVPASSSSASGASGRTSRSARTTRPWSPPSARASRGCRWRSSSPPRA